MDERIAVSEGCSLLTKFGDATELRIAVNEMNGKRSHKFHLITTGAQMPYRIFIASDTIFLIVQQHSTDGLLVELVQAMSRFLYSCSSGALSISGIPRPAKKAS